MPGRMCRLGRLVDIVDVAAVSKKVPDDELRTLTRAWGVRRLWRTTDAAVQSLLYRGPMPVCTRTWARNLPLVRERSVLESHLERVFASFWALGVLGAVKQMAHATAQHFRPEPGESRRVKIGRSIRALRSPLVERHRPRPGDGGSWIASTVEGGEQWQLCDYERTI